MDSLPAWAEHGRGRGRGKGRGDRGSKPARGVAPVTRGGFGSRGGGVGGRGDAGKYRGRGGQGGRRGRGKHSDFEWTGGNTEAVPERKGKRKIVTEERLADEAKKVKLADLTSEPSSSSSPSSAPAPQAISANSADNPPSTSGTAKEGGGKKSLLGLLLKDGRVDAGKGYGLFD
jgi:hypothetical protein